MMRVTLFGTRGSIPAPGPETIRYGGNTAAVEVCGKDGTVLVLDAGTGIRRLGTHLSATARVDILLSHLHMDHIQGLGFFGPLFNPRTNVHVLDPASSVHTLEARLARYLFTSTFPLCICVTCPTLFVTRCHVQHFTSAHFAYNIFADLPSRSNCGLSNRIGRWHSCLPVRSRTRPRAAQWPMAFFGLDFRL